MTDVGPPKHTSLHWVFNLSPQFTIVSPQYSECLHHNFLDGRGIRIHQWVYRTSNYASSIEGLVKSRRGQLLIKHPYTTSVACRGNQIGIQHCLCSVIWHKGVASMKDNLARRTIVRDSRSVSGGHDVIPFFGSGWPFSIWVAVNTWPSAFTSFWM